MAWVSQVAPYAIQGMGQLGSVGSAAKQGGSQAQQQKVQSNGINYFGTIFEPNGQVRDTGDIIENFFNPLKFGGIFDTGDGEDETVYDPYWAYTPEQKAMHQKLGPYLTGKLGAAADLYKGDYTAPMTQAEQDVLTQNARMSALGEQGLTNLLKGEFPEQYYRDTIYQPQLKSWQEDILPQINESYAGPSGAGFFGSARGGATAKSGRDLMDNLNAQRGNLAWNVQQNVPNAITAANALSTTSAAIQSTPRLIQQYGLDREYAEWVRGGQEQQKYVDQAIQFMGLSSGVMDVGNTAIPEGSGNLNGISNLIGSLMGGMGGKTNDYSNYVQTQTSPGYGSSNYYSNYPTSSNSYGTNSLGGYNSYGELGNAYNSSALGAMDWQNTGNYQALGSGSYQ